MTLKRFIVTYNGQKLDYDNAHGYQCVDLARFYFRDVLKVNQPPSVDGAKDLIKYPGELKVSYDSYAPGDVLIYGPTAKNKFGHVCILVALLDSDTFIVFEQDGLKQDGAKLTTRGKDNLLGCLYKE